MLNLGLPDSHFDAVICVFGIFFVPDMHAAVRELWRRVSPAGKLAITTLGPRFFEPASTAFWNSIRRVRPDLYKGFNPWDRITDTDSVRAILSATDVNPEARVDSATRLDSAAAVNCIQVSMELGTNAVSAAEDWWSMVLGSGYRGTIEQLDAESL
jgi:SAM-dependent methyltransferase